MKFLMLIVISVFPILLAAESVNVGPDKRTASIDVEVADNDSFVIKNLSGVVKIRVSEAIQNIKVNATYRQPTSLDVADIKMQSFVVELSPADSKGQILLSVKKGGKVEAQTVSGSAPQLPKKGLLEKFLSFFDVNRLVTKSVSAIVSELALGSVDLTIYIPLSLIHLLQVSARSGDIEFLGHPEHKSKLKNANFKTDYGKVTIRHLRSVDSTEGISIKTSNGDISLNDVTTSQDLVVATAYGTTDLRNVHAKHIESSSENGDITLETGTGSLELKTDYGEVRVSHLKPSDSTEGISIRTLNGGISLNDVTTSQHLAVTTAYGATDLRNVHAKHIESSSENGNITLDTGTGSLKLKTDYGEVRVSHLNPSDSTVGISIETDNGDIKLDYVTTPHNLRVTTAYGATDLKNINAVLIQVIGNGNINTSTTRGTLNLSSDHGTVDFSDHTGDAVVTSESCQTSLRNLVNGSSDDEL